MRIHHKLLLLVAPFVLVPLGVLSVIFHEVTLRASIEGWMQGGAVHIERIEARLDERVRNARVRAEVLARSDAAMRALLTRVPGTDSPFVPGTPLGESLLALSREPNVRAVRLQGPDGATLASFPASVAPAGRRPEMEIAVPVRAPAVDGAAPLGAISLRLDAEVIEPVAGRPGLDSPLLVLYDAEREALATSHADFVPWRTSPREIAEMLAAHDESTLSRIGVAERSHLAFARAVGPGLIAAVMLPEADLRAVTRRRAIELALAVAAVLATLVAGVGYGFRRLVGVPLARLWRSAELIAEGDLGHPVDQASRADEIGALAASLEGLRRGAMSVQGHTDRLVNEDALTGLPNRRSMLERIEAEIERCNRNGSGVFAVMFIDLDNFKAVNDSMGHSAGDRLIVKVAQRLLECLRAYDSVGTGTPRPSSDTMDVRNLDLVPSDAEESTDFVARLGGDEFLVLLNDIVDSANAARVAQRVYALFEEPLLIDELKLRVSLSIGMVMYPSNGETADQLIKNADVAMYSAKCGGKNQYRFFDDGMESAARRTLEVESELRQALSENELELHYQPQIDLRTGRFVGSEALVRWFHQDKGWVSPAEFVPIAESCGLIHELGNWVVAAACRQARSWLKDGLDVGHISINLSAHQIASEDLAERITELIKSHALDPGRLEFELTETALFRNGEAVKRNIVALRKLGVHVALDDFGTGYSSLAWVRDCPVDMIKIDRCFVTDLDREPTHGAIIASVVELARRLELVVTAEGIETEAESRAVQALGCHRGQGFLYSKPLPADEFSALIRQGRGGEQPAATRAVAPAA